jgi:hypothetical protein
MQQPTRRMTRIICKHEHLHDVDAHIFGQWAAHAIKMVAWSASWGSP